MFHLQKAFENSLRGGYGDISPTNLKAKLSLQHKSCKGTMHALGNYCKSPTLEKITNGVSPKLPNNNRLTSKAKSSSVSSEGFSESDSVDSLGEKNSSKNSDVNVEEANKKNLSICDRLHTATTKASQAKTAKMRYLEDADDDDIMWIEDLTNGIVKTGDEKPEHRNDSEKRSRRREVLKKVLSAGKSPLENKPKEEKETPNGFNRTSQARASFSRASFRRGSNPINNQKSQPLPPPKNLRASFRSSCRRGSKKFSKAICENYEDVAFRANNKKVHCLGDDRNNFFKDFDSMKKYGAVYVDEEQVRFKQSFINICSGNTYL